MGKYMGIPFTYIQSLQIIYILRKGFRIFLCRINC